VLRDIFSFITKKTAGFAVNWSVKVVIPGLSEIKSGSETLASMIFENCNPGNQQSFNKQKLSKNKIFVTETRSDVGTPSMTKEAKQKWYPLFIKKNASPEELATSIEILTCLFFGMGNM
jgi:hypothetical protein